jgi:hypothetical protein
MAMFMLAAPTLLLLLLRRRWHNVNHNFAGFLRNSLFASGVGDSHVRHDDGFWREII